MPSFDDLHRFVDGVLDAGALRATNDPNGVWRPGRRDVHVTGLLLDPHHDTSAWIDAEAPDALIVHRPWGLPERLPGDPGVLAYHLAFDERFTVGLNPMLADALDMTGLEAIGSKDGRPLGMIGAVEPQRLAAFASRVEREFGQITPLPGAVEREISRVAVVGAMWPELVVEAAERGAEVYVTGTLRVRALPAVESTGVAVICVGHRSAELWGLRTLAGLITDRFGDVRVVIAPT